MAGHFKHPTRVPTSSDFIDIILTRTQRTTATVVHPQFHISRIKRFYMKKVQVTSQNFTEKLATILEDFPRLDDIHPFYADLFNVLYNRDHYKLALGQVNTARHVIDTICRDYVRLLKHGESQYQCKQLKRAALGRMCTLIRKLRATLGYLEEVRKHMSRLPWIDVNTRTLLICGYPNVGKSSFLNNVSRADVDVQSYAFTTKSLQVGHTDYKYLRWQVIDTPGILDHQLDERNIIEMQAVTALAHLQCAVLCFIDISEQCGYTIEKQVQLFKNIRPLFATKPLVIVLSKVDVVKFDQISAPHRELIEGLSKMCGGCPIVEMSNTLQEGIALVKETACDHLLSERVDAKVQSKKINSVLNRLTVATPVKRDGKQRESQIPESVLRARQEKKKAKDSTGDMDVEGEEAATAPKKRLLKDRMWEEGGPGVFSFDLREHHILKEDDWKMDTIPEILDGKNIADFVDPDIWEKLKEVEKEEEALTEAFEMEESESSADEEERAVVKAIKSKATILKKRHDAERGKNAPPLPAKYKRAQRSVDGFRQEMASMGVITEGVVATEAANKTARQKRKREDSRPPSNKKRRVDTGEDMDGEEEEEESAVFHPGTGFATKEQKKKARHLMKRSQKKFQNLGKAGEADRVIQTKMPRHLFAGKRGIGKTDRR